MKAIQVVNRPLRCLAVYEYITKDFPKEGFAKSLILHKE